MRQLQPVAPQHALLGLAPWQLVALAVVIGIFAPDASASASASQHASMPDPATFQDVYECRKDIWYSRTQIAQCRADVAAAMKNQENRISGYKDYIATFLDEVPTGQEACEGHNYDQEECDARGCCHFDVQGQVCITRVGTQKCPQVAGAQDQAEVTKLQNEQDKMYQEIRSLATSTLIQARKRSKFLQRSTRHQNSPFEEDKEGAEFWAFHASAVNSSKVSSNTEAACSIIFNTPEFYRGYSSVYLDQRPGTGHAQSALNSSQAWSAATESPGEHLIMDIGQVAQVAGVATQARAPEKSWETVTSYTVEYSTDFESWVSIDGTFEGAEPHEFEYVKQMFPNTVFARYVKLTVASYKFWPSMRAGLILCKAVPMPALINLVDAYLSCNSERGTGQKALTACIAQNVSLAEWNAAREGDYKAKIKRYLEQYLEEDYRKDALKQRKTTLQGETGRLSGRLQALRDGVSGLRTR